MDFDFDKLDPKRLEAWSVAGKKCEFCGRDAFSGELRTDGGAIYWCFDCGLEFGGILQGSVFAERPDLLQRGIEESSFLSFCPGAKLRAWCAAASQKAARTLKEKRRQDGREKGS